MFKLYKVIVCYIVFLTGLCGMFLNCINEVYAEEINESKIIENCNEESSQNIKNISDDILVEFVDKYINNKMEEYNVPGLEVSIIRNDKLILNKGYGYADVNEKRKVDVNKTTFPAASVSKLFTAVAIMQLYEQGKIDLDKDVNEYIYPYEVQNKFKKPVTCRNLLTHSSGLDEESEINTKTEDINNIKSQEYYFEHNQPIVIVQPDTICRYSNQGYNLLGFIIEKVSSQKYEEYIKNNILRPLNMSNTSVRINSENMAKGYMDDNKESVPFSYQYTSGSSGIISTSGDMKNFMSAILNNGSYEGNVILKPETIKLMESTQFTNSSCFSGMGLGFIKDDTPSAKIIKHEGALPGYVSTMFMLPEENIGIYISTNKMGPLPFDFEEEFKKTFLNKDNSLFLELFNSRNVQKDYSIYEGHYRSYDGISKRTISKVFSLDEDSEIKDNKDGTLTLREYTNDHTVNITRLVEKEENVFVREDNKGFCAFKLNDMGKVKYAFNNISHNTFEKINILEYKEVIFISVSGSIIFFLINIIITIIFKIKNNKKHENILSNKLMVVNFFGDILGICGFFITIVLSSILMYFNDYYFSFKLLYIPLAMLLLYAVISIFLLLLYIFNIYKKSFTIKEIIYWSIINIVNIIMLLNLYYLNMLGFKLS